MLILDCQLMLLTKRKNRAKIRSLISNVLELQNI